MPYLIPSDYTTLIQQDNLNQVISGNPAILDRAYRAALEEASSKIRQKYDLSRELTDTIKWDITKEYKAADRVYLTADAYNPANTYAIDMFVTFGSNGILNVYKSNKITTPGVFNTADWDLVGPDNSIFYVQNPHPYFDVYALYAVGDRVFYKGKTYTAIQASKPQTFPPDPNIEYYELVPNPNAMPDTPGTGAAQWGVGVPYLVNAGTIITDTSKWTYGDNRSALLVMYIVDLTLYHVHSRISPRNIPDLRVKRYDDAIMALRKDFSEGGATPNVPVIQPRTGGRIRFGGNTKKSNTY